MTIEAQLEQNNGLLSRIVALLEGGSLTVPGAAAAPSANTAAAAPRPRGRPAKGEAATPAAPAASTAAPEADPFDTPAAPVTPTATEEQVRAALTALKEATTQDNAVKILKESSGVDNLTELRKTPEKYGLVVAAANAALPGTGATAVADPFETAAEAPAKQPTLEEVKAACVAAGKRTGQDKVQKIVMEHGGRGKNAATGVEGPSLNALPAGSYAAVIAAVLALPTTK